MFLRFYLCFLCFIVVSIQIPSNLNAEENKAVKARVENWIPAFWQENGDWRGMDIDFYKALEKESGLAFTYSELPWSRALRSIKYGSCDIMTQLSITPEREEYINFLGPYNHEEMVLVVHKDDINLEINNLDQLIELAEERRQKIGVERDSWYGESFAEKNEK